MYLVLLQDAITQFTSIYLSQKKMKDMKINIYIYVIYRIEFPEYIYIYRHNPT